MAKCKKVLSIVLCLIMLLGTLTIGLLGVSAASEYTCKTYADLADTYGSNFYYMGVEFYDTDTGALIEDTVYGGETITAKCYIKSDYSVYAGTYYFVFDGDMFDFVSKSGVADDANGKVTVTSVTAKSAKFYSTNTKTGVTTITPAFSDYTTEQMEKWEVVKVTNSNASTTATARDTKNDAVTFSYNLTVKSDAVTDAATGLGCHFRMFDAAFSCYEGDATTYVNQCYLGGSASTYRAAKADHFETSGPRTFKLAKTISFADADGTALLENVIANAGDKINLADYVPTVEGKTFKCWSLNGAKVSGEYTVTDNVTLRAIWEGDEGTVSLMATNSEGKWAEVAEYYGTAGEAITLDDITAMTSIANDNIDKVAEGTGVEDAEVVIKNLAFSHTDEDTGEAVFTTLGKAAPNLYKTELKFGTTTEVYIVSSFSVTYNVYAPTVGDDGVITENDVLYSTAKTEFLNENFDGEYLANGTTALDDYAWLFAKGKVGDAAITDNELSSQLYTVTYEDGNGKAYTYDNGVTSVALTKDNFTEGKTLTVDFYVKATSNTFYIAFNAGKDSYIVADKAYAFGDTVDSSAFAGEGFVSTATNTKFSISGLYDDGAAASMSGYTLKDITYTTSDGTVIDMDGDGSFVIDADAVKALRKSVGNANLEKGAKFLVITADWEAGEYDFTVLYQNADSEWVTLATKTYTGNSKVTPSNFLDADLLAKATEDAPEGAVPNQTQFEDETGKAIFSVNAYDGPMTLRMSYNKGTRYAYIDYNNLEKLGEEDEAQAGANYSYKKLSYGDTLYVEDYDYETNGSANAPYFTQFTDTLVVPNGPEVTYKTDDDGNIMYEPLTQIVYEDDGVTPKKDPVTGKTVTEPVMQDKKDADGNVVLDASGNPVQEEVPDTTKPIVAQDPKGNCAYRPYRNCEYMGYKIYHVEGIFDSYSSLMAAKDQWVEGYENEEKTIQQTDILVMQWKSDKEFKYRIYTNGKALYCAKGTDGKMYYWNSNGSPCNKGESKLNSSDESFILYYRKRTEDCTFANGEKGTLDYYYAFTIGLANLHPRFLPDLFPLIMKLLKGLL